MEMGSEFHAPIKPLRHGNFLQGSFPWRPHLVPQAYQGLIQDSMDKLSHTLKTGKVKIPDIARL